MNNSKPIFNIISDFDLCTIPYSPVTEKDNLEIRAQIFNSGISGEVTTEIYFDEDLIAQNNLKIETNTYGFVNTFVNLKDKIGFHTVTVKLHTDFGEFINSKASLQIEVKKEKIPVLNGGYIMLGPPNDRKPCDTYRDELKQFTDEDWQNYISEMHKIGQECIIIMVSQQYLTLAEKELVAHYPSKLIKKSDITAKDPIKAVLSEAEKNGQKVFIGVGNQFGHKGTIEEMTELYEMYKNFKSFYGWYFATELRMDLPEKEHLEKWQLYNYLYNHAHTLCPVKLIIISPMGMPCKEFCEYFKDVYFCDILMPQDWVGQCAFHIEDSEEMHKKLSILCKSINKHLWANCESFNFTDTPDGKWENWGCTFKDFPWDAPRVLVPRFRGGGMIGEQGFDKQIKAAHPYVEKIMTFMLSGFFCPPDFNIKCGGDAAVNQYKEYVDYINGVAKEIK